jgi:hypothetical protein
MAGNGSVELAALAARLKVTGSGGLRVQLLRGLKSGAAPLIPLVQQAALNQLPKSGGLNEQVASQKVSVSVRTGARTAGVRLTTTAPDTAQTDAGFVRHPTFGRRGKGEWKSQQIPAAVGWWSKTLANATPTVAPALNRVMLDVYAEIMGRP